jgi:hypothetical protein
MKNIGWTFNEPDARHYGRVGRISLSSVQLTRPHLFPRHGTWRLAHPALGI